MRPFRYGVSPEDAALEYKLSSQPRKSDNFRVDKAESGENRRRAMLHPIAWA